jgi:hypothetical protein
MRIRVCALVLLVVLAVGGALTSIARADGDPGSDVLVSQDLFVASDASVSVKQQVQLGGLLRAADRAGFPVRVAIIASSYDLGAITALWLKPRSYARFLGLELSLAYKQRLLVVMPNGFGFNWPGHSTASAYRLLAEIPRNRGGTGLAGAAESAVRRLAGASGIKVAARTAVTRNAAPVLRTAATAERRRRGTSTTAPSSSWRRWPRLPPRPSRSASHSAAAPLAPSAQASRPASLPEPATQGRPCLRSPLRRHGRRANPRSERLRSAKRGESIGDQPPLGSG